MKIIGIGLIVAGVTAVSLANAGSHYSNNVLVYTGQASGNISAARFSSDGNQYVGCYTVAWAGSPLGACFFNDSSNHYFSCYTSDPNMLATMHGINATSYLYASTGPDGSTCNYLEVYNDSQFLD